MTQEQRLLGIVLKRVDYGESDRIVTFFTRELGKVAAFARSARKSQKRFGGSLEPFHRLRLSARDRRGDLLSLGSAEIDRARTGIVLDLDLIARASYVTELVSEATREREPHADLFDLLDGGFEVLGSAEFAALERVRRDGWLCAFELKLLSLAGYRPFLSACAECGDTASARYRFVPERGALLCAAHADGRGVPVGAGTARLLDKSLGAPLDHLERLTFSAQQVEEARRLLSTFLRHQLGKELKSAKFLEDA